MDTKFLFKSFSHIEENKVSNIPLDLDTFSYKFSSLDFVRKSCNKYINNVLDQVPIKGSRKRILVDIKVHYLKKGEIPALPNWHIDGTGFLLDDDETEINHLFISDDCSATEFLKDDVELELENNRMTDLDEYLDGIETVKIAPNTIYSYLRSPHRATPAVRDGKRMLIRVTETNTIQPRNQKIEVTYR